MRVNPFSGTASAPSSGTESSGSGSGSVSFDAAMNASKKADGESLLRCGTPPPRPGRPRPTRPGKPQPTPQPQPKPPIATTQAVGEEGPPLPVCEPPWKPVPVPLPVEPRPDPRPMPIEPVGPPEPAPPIVVCPPPQLPRPPIRPGPPEMTTMALGEEGGPGPILFDMKADMKSARGPFLIEDPAPPRTLDRVTKSSSNAGDM